MANGKAKGSEFERFIAKSLSKWWSKNAREDLFWRTHNSGGRFTVRRQKGLDTHHQGGDICNVHPEAELFSEVFYVECKAYKSIGLWTIATDKGLIWEWWKKVVADAGNKIPVLIVKENNKPILLMTNNDGRFLFVNSVPGGYPKFEFRINDHCISTYMFDAFLKFDVDVIKAACDLYRKLQSERRKSTICDTQA